MLERTKVARCNPSNHDEVRQLRGLVMGSLGDVNGFGAVQGGREGRSMPYSGLRSSSDGCHAAGYSEVALDDDPGSFGTPYLGQLPHAGLRQACPLSMDEALLKDGCAVSLVRE
jgi:hypothetical protein